MKYPLLEKIESPNDLKSLSKDDLETLCLELRVFIEKETDAKVSHVNSSLGVVELTVALHYHFHTPEDILIWDVGHQSYAHKILTERKRHYHKLRKLNGIAGFTSRAESVYDPFGAGHSSTSISALAGFCISDEIKSKKRTKVAVIGDGSLTGGMSFEGLNHIGENQWPCLVILNDNESSIDANRGALQKLNSYHKWADSLGFEYLQLSTGNDIHAILDLFNSIGTPTKPVFLHLKTQKGETKSTRNISTSEKTPNQFSDCLRTFLDKHLNKNPQAVFLSPAMLSGAGVESLQEKYPGQIIDVGIAEQHCVTMGAALAAEGHDVLIHLYSSFSQRAVDQIIHDVALQKLPVVFLFDRAGLVGEDGPTHHGSFDKALFTDIPHINIAAPANGKALDTLLKKALCDRNTAWIIRFGKHPFELQNQKLWTSAQAHWWNRNDSNKLILSSGSMADLAQEVAVTKNINHLHLPIIKPFPTDKIKLLLKRYSKIVSVEEGSYSGGIAAAMRRFLGDELKDKHYIALHLDDLFYPSGKREELLRLAKLDKESIERALL